MCPARYLSSARANTFICTTRCQRARSPVWTNKPIRDPSNPARLSRTTRSMATLIDAHDGDAASEDDGNTASEAAGDAPSEDVEDGERISIVASTHLIQELHGRISLLAADINQQKEVLKQLEARKSALQLQLNAILDPITRLPFDISSEIFVECLHEYTSSTASTMAMLCAVPNLVDRTLADHLVRIPRHRLQQSIFSHMLTSRLQTLLLSLYNPGLVHLLQFLKRYSPPPPLQKLVLWWSNDWDELEECLSLLPTLTQIDLPSGDAPTQLIALLAVSPHSTLLDVLLVRRKQLGVAVECDYGSDPPTADMRASLQQSGKPVGSGEIPDVESTSVVLRLPETDTD
ncbi:hypothetical protein DFH09DRAFT_1340706 [Mycena vulgaris]|nr:hypothetical protein DFH09DRAFT_1340706 [Mycena vulgaris]